MDLQPPSLYLCLCDRSSRPVIQRSTNIRALNRRTSVLAANTCRDLAHKPAVCCRIQEQNIHVRQHIAAPEAIDFVNCRLRRVRISRVVDDGHQRNEDVIHKDVHEVLYGAGECVDADAWLRGQRHELTWLVLGIGEGSLRLRSESVRVIGCEKVGSRIEEAVDCVDVGVPLGDAVDDLLGAWVHDGLDETAVLAFLQWARRGDAGECEGGGCCGGSHGGVRAVGMLHNGSKRAWRCGLVAVECER